MRPRQHAGRLRLVALVHHPLALETGLAAPLAGRLRDSERRALACVATSSSPRARTAEVLQRDYEVGPASASPSSSPVPTPRRSPAARSTAACHSLCVASLSPRKGHDVLFRALGAHRERSWRLVCVGDVQRDAATAARLRALLRRAADRGQSRTCRRSRRSGDWRRSTMQRLFVLATLYEGYGMAVAEALARGLPVVSTPTGGIPDLVGDDAGLLVPPGDVDGWIRGAVGNVRRRRASQADGRRPSARARHCLRGTMCVVRMSQALQCA